MTEQLPAKLVTRVRWETTWQTEQHLLSDRWVYFRPSERQDDENWIFPHLARSDYHGTSTALSDCLFWDLRLRPECFLSASQWPGLDWLDWLDCHSATNLLADWLTAPLWLWQWQPPGLLPATPSRSQLQIETRIWLQTTQDFILSFHPFNQSLVMGMRYGNIIFNDINNFYSKNYYLWILRQ